MIITKFLRPINLTTTQTTCIYKFIKIFIISEDKNFIFAVFQIFKSFNNSQKLIIINYIPSLARTIIGYQILLKVR